MKSRQEGGYGLHAVTQGHRYQIYAMFFIGYNQTMMANC